MTGSCRMYCSLCGGPFFGKQDTLGSPSEWLSEIVLLTTGSRSGDDIDLYRPGHEHDGYSYRLGPNADNDCERTVLELSATYDESNLFTIETGEQVSAMCVQMNRIVSGVGIGGELYLPLHRACLQVADQFIASSPAPSMPSSDDSITSKQKLWEVLYRRLPGGPHSPRTFIVPEPQDYLGGRHCRNVEWEPDDDPEYAKMFEQNPMTVPDLMSKLLRSLFALGAVSILSFQHTQVNLISRSVLPWLWDIDQSQVNMVAEMGPWKWGELVHLLSKDSIHDPHDASLDLPLALRNRRRIWRLLEAARVDDVADAAIGEIKWARSVIEQARPRIAHSGPPYFLPMPPGIEPS